MTHTEADFKVVKGELTNEELAAVVLVLRQITNSSESASAIKSEWNSANRNVRKHLEHGPSMWRRSALPK
jgi:hypothetical protein